MTTYKYISDTVVAKIDDDGKSRMSCSVENQEYLAWLAEGNTPEPADPLPNPRIQEIKTRLTQIDVESVRALRAKSIGRGHQNDDTKLTALEDEAAALRVELSGL